jgi:hypothetical protein
MTPSPEARPEMIELIYENSPISLAVRQLIAARDAARAQADELDCLLREFIRANDDGVFGDVGWKDREAALWRRAHELTR